jgi:hypothetical protein
MCFKFTADSGFYVIIVLEDIACLYTQQKIPIMVTEYVHIKVQ